MYILYSLYYIVLYPLAHEPLGPARTSVAGAVADPEVRGHPAGGLARPGLPGHSLH